MSAKRVQALFLAMSLITAISIASVPQEKTAAEKYNAFCGQYRFDLTAYGISVIVAKVFVEGEALYIWADTSDSADEIYPVINEATKFFVDDPNEGHWDLEFIKDDKGKFTKCRIINAGMGIDATGEKIDG